MKKVICAGLMIAGLFITKGFAQEQQGQVQPQEQGGDQIQLPPGSWIVIEPRQYTIDQSCRVMSTADGITWAASPTNSWMDIDGSLYHLEDKQIYRSIDGKTWEPVKDNRWQDVLGNQLMLTSDCSVVTGNSEGLSMQSGRQQEPVKLDKAAITEEKKTYTERMNKRLAELETELKQLKKDVKKHPEKKELVAAHESNISRLKQGLADIGSKADEEWDTFKKDIDTLF